MANFVHFLLRNRIRFITPFHTFNHNFLQKGHTVAVKNYQTFNPLTPRSDQHETSPRNILTLSSKQLMRMFILMR